MPMFPATSDFALFFRPEVPAQKSLQRLGNGNDVHQPGRILVLGGGCLLAERVNWFVIGLFGGSDRAGNFCFDARLRILISSCAALTMTMSSLVEVTAAIVGKAAFGSSPFPALRPLPHLPWANQCCSGSLPP